LFPGFPAGKSFFTAAVPDAFCRKKAFPDSAQASPFISFHPEILYFRMLKLMVFFPETRSFFFWQGNQAIMRRRILIR